MPPDYIRSDSILTLGTSGRQKRAKNAIESGQVNATAVVTEWFDMFVRNIGAWTVEKQPVDTLFARVREAIDASVGVRDELLTVCESLLRHGLDGNEGEVLHHLLEEMLPLGKWQGGEGSWYNGQADHHLAFRHEIFLNIVSLAIKYGRFGAVRTLFTREYYISDNAVGDRSGMESFATIRQHSYALAAMNEHSGPRWLSPVGQLLKERSNYGQVKFADLIQADLLAYLRGECLGGSWWPDTVTYASRRTEPFEIFVRSRSRSCFDKVLMAFDMSSGEFMQLLREFKSGERTPPNWRGDRVNIPLLCNHEQLGVAN
jgi:hypothetical protein